MNVGGSSMCGVCRSRSRGSASSVAVQHVVYVDQHGKVLAQRTAPMVLLSLAFLQNTRAEVSGWCGPNVAVSRDMRPLKIHSSKFLWLISRVPANACSPV